MQEPRLTDHERRALALDAQADTLLTHLLAQELTPDLRTRLCRYVELVEQANTERYNGWEYNLVEGLAAHLPAFAPTIRGLALHVACEQLDQRCRDGCRHPWPNSGQFYYGEEVEE